jgi:tetratricopeptide (TPR) repeat protein
MRQSSDLLDQILINGPSQSTILLILTAMKEEGRISEVIQGCLKALDNYPGDTHLRKLLAESYQEVGFIGRAEEELNRVTSEIDKLSSAYELQARIYAQQERFDESLESLKRYLALNPDDREGLDLLDKIKPAEPEEKQEESVVDLATPTLAELYFSQGQIPEAINTYEKVLIDNPDDKASEQRLAELKASISQEAKHLPTEEDDSGIKAEKTIAVLENWLNKIQTMDNG